jgi:uncharacterized protein (TIGR02996 family)
MTNEEAGLLQAIFDVPAEDAPRLAYADWLEKRGDPLGEFVRIQCVRSAPSNPDAKSQNLKAREQELLKAHGEQWLGPLRQIGEDWRFERGFVAAGNVDARRFKDEAGSLFALAPLLREVRLRHVKPCLGDVFRSPHFARVCKLDLSHEELVDDDMWCFYDLPHQCQLRELDLSFNQLTSAGIELLEERFNDENGPIFTTLSVARNRLGVAGVQALARSPIQSHLKSLDISGNDIKSSGVAWLASAFDQLTTLDISDNGIGGPDDFNDWFSVEFEDPTLFTGVHKEIRYRSRINREYYEYIPGTQAALAVVCSSMRGRLVYLNMASNALGNEGAQCLASHARLFPDFDLCEDWRGTAETPDWPRLVSLDLRENAINDDLVIWKLNNVFGARVQL